VALDRVFGEHSLIFIRSEQLFDWARARSLWYQAFGIACCSLEGLLAASGPRFDFDRHGVFFRGVPRQSDVMIVAGTVNYKMAAVVKRLYEQMPDPKFVISLGACANTGGPFREYPNVLQGVNEIVPVDMYVPGCPPRPESVQYAFLQLREKIYAQTDERLAARDRWKQGYPEEEKSPITQGERIKVPVPLPGVDNIPVYGAPRASCCSNASEFVTAGSKAEASANSDVPRFATIALPKRAPKLDSDA
jgi:NADH-quinone oxidoreductase subunit B